MKYVRLKELIYNMKTLKIDKRMYHQKLRECYSLIYINIKDKGGGVLSQGHIQCDRSV
jgi:hypothetical protein